jgi:hypothetical protein
LRTFSFTVPWALSSTPVDEREPRSVSVRERASVAIVDSPRAAIAASTIIPEFFMILSFVWRPVRGAVWAPSTVMKRKVHAR